MKAMLSGALAAIGLALTGTAWAEPFVLVVKETPQEVAKRPRTDGVGAAYWTAYAAFGDALRRAGVLRGGAPLGAPHTAVRVVNGVVAETAIERPDGLWLGGFFVIDVPDAVSASAWAARAPAALTGRVEVYRVPASPAMAE